jgi:hypothetical protein
MAQLDWVSCKVALGGDIRNVVFRSQYDPVSVPELDIIAAIHGENSVTEIAYCTTTETTSADEKIRLAGKYGDKILNELFPGRNPNMGMLAPDRPAGLEAESLPSVPASQGAAKTSEEIEKDAVERAKAAVLSQRPAKKPKAPVAPETTTPSVEE